MALKLEGHIGGFYLVKIWLSLPLQLPSNYIEEDDPLDDFRRTGKRVDIKEIEKERVYYVLINDRRYVYKSILR